MRAKSPKKNHAKNQRSPVDGTHKVPFIEHVLELRRRLFIVAASIIGWSIAAYFVQLTIVSFLLRPAEGQSFIYTSPGGGLDFLVRVCLYTGITLTIPVAVYQLLQYLRPLIKNGHATRFMMRASAASGVLALLGIAFGYYIGLPTALHFLLHQFSSDQIRPLLTIQSYMSFVTAYLLGSALLFQLPLIMLLINRLKPLKPKKLLGYERWVILFAFIAGAIINPSPRIQDQVLLAGPIILTYQLGIFLVWRANRKHRASVAELVKQDEEIRAARQAKFAEAQAALRARQGLAPAPAAPSVVQQPALQAAPAQPLQPARPVATPALQSAQPTLARPVAMPGMNRPVRRYVNDFTRRPANYTPARRPSIAAEA
jgi:sec-independent protein translocase protein TatC